MMAWHNYDHFNRPLLANGNHQLHERSLIKNNIRKGIRKKFSLHQLTNIICWNCFCSAGTVDDSNGTSRAGYLDKNKAPPTNGTNKKRKRKKRNDLAAIAEAIILADGNYYYLFLLLLLLLLLMPFIYAAYLYTILDLDIIRHFLSIAKLMVKTFTMPLSYSIFIAGRSIWPTLFKRTRTNAFTLATNEYRILFFIFYWWLLLLVFFLFLCPLAVATTVVAAAATTDPDDNINFNNSNESLFSSSSSLLSSSSSSSSVSLSSISSNTFIYNKNNHQTNPTAKQTAIGQNITRILNAFFDSGYDKRVRPNYAGPPVQVGVTMHIISISSISAVQMDFTSDFYFRQSWRDSRLSFKPQPGIQALYVGAEVSEKIWVPDTFFANEKAAQFHMATTPNTFIRIKSNGDVFLSMRLTVTSSCPMNLQYFPMDRQSCTIEVESYGYSMADIQYKWGIDGQGSDVVLAKNLELPQFKVYKHLQRRKVEVLSTGNYSRLVCEIEFVRSMGYYLIQIYIPASLIVIISWVSFWLHRNASPARVQLGVTTVLTMTTLMSSTNAAMPKISYIKSIDVFLGTCFVMVFAALLEYATVGYMGKRIAMRKTRTQQIVRMLNEHREKCIAAAAAAAAHEAKDVDPNVDDDTTIRRHGALIRTASLYPNMEQLDELESYHKRGFRSQGYNIHYGGHQGSGHLERTSSLKSRVYTDNGDDTETGPNFNDDLNVFVAANSGSGPTTAVGGSSSPFYPIVDHHGNIAATSSQYHHERGSGAARRASNIYDSVNRDMKHLAERAFLPSSYYIKNQNTLFGVCPSDIDKYSRVVFPVCFLCFNLMYWIIYMHISEFLIEDQQSIDGINQNDD